MVITGVIIFGSAPDDDKSERLPSFFVWIFKYILNQLVFILSDEIDSLTPDGYFSVPVINRNKLISRRLISLHVRHTIFVDNSFYRFSIRSYLILN